METYAIEYLRSAAAVIAAGAEWRELFQRSNASPWLSHEWFATVLTAFPCAARLCVAMVRRGRRLEAIVPLQISQRRLGFLTLTLLEPACGGWATRCAALLPAGREEEELDFIEMVIADLPEQGIFWDCCCLPGVAAAAAQDRPAGYLAIKHGAPEEDLPGTAASRWPGSQSRGRGPGTRESGAAGPFAATAGGPRMLAAGRDPFRRQIIPIGSSVIIDLPATWAEYRATVSKNQRKKLAYRLNLFARAGRGRLVRLGFDPPGQELKPIRPECAHHSGGQVSSTAPDHPCVAGPQQLASAFEFESVAEWPESSDSSVRTGAAELDRLLEDALRVSRKSWQHSAASGWAISDPGAGDFFLRVSRQLAAARLLDISVLYLDDRPVSFIWGAVAGSHAHINKLGFDRDLAALSPGFVHIAWYIQDSISRGLSDADFGHEFHDYKSAWGQRGIDLVDIYYYSGGARALVLRAVRALRQRQQAPQPRPQEE